MDTVNWGFPEKLGNRNDCITTETYVRARIHQQYFGEFIGKEVLIRNSNGLDCYGTLNFQNKGELFIIKGMTGYKGHEELVSTTPLKSEIVHLSICDYNTVRINELDQLEGWINKRPSIKHRKWTKFWKIVSFGLIQRKQRTDYHYKQQTMTITEFNDLIKRKYNTVTNT